MIRRRALVSLVAVAVGLASCSSNTGANTGASGSATSAIASGSGPAGSAPATVPAVPTTGPSTVLGATTVPGTRPSRTKLEGFKEITVKIRQPDGSVREVCLLLADTEELREQGLMHVTDRSLGGYPGMLFLFDRDEQSGLPE